jgi:tryptophan synthase alpha chain
VIGDDVEQAVRGIREISDVPVCVGFGVSTPEHAERIGAFADGVVVGSALVNRIEAAASPTEAVEAAAQFVAELKASLRPNR